MVLTSQLTGRLQQRILSPSELVYNQNDTVNKTSLTIPASTLQSNTHYYIRIRHRDDATPDANISNWSKVAEFNTGLPIQTPTVTIASPALIPVITSSAYSGSNNTLELIGRLQQIFCSLTFTKNCWIHHLFRHSLRHKLCRITHCTLLE